MKGKVNDVMQKVNFRDVLAIKGLGSIDDSRPIDLQEYITPYSQEKRVIPLSVMPIPQKICLSKKIGNTVYDVTANFNMDGKETILQQFKTMILAAEL